jgi:hypothetical protein
MVLHDSLPLEIEQRLPPDELIAQEVMMNGDQSITQKDVGRQWCWKNTRLALSIGKAAGRFVLTPMINDNVHVASRQWATWRTSNPPTSESKQRLLLLDFIVR